MSERTENAPLLTGHLADGQTRERILRAAERLFAEHGYSGVSLRTIMAEAGANTASVHYYFRGKEGLLRALFDMRTGPMNAERVRLLDVCQNEFEQGQLTIRKLIAAFAGPAIRSGWHPNGVLFEKLSAQCSVDPNPAVRRVVFESYHAVAMRFVSMLRAICPHLSDTEFYWRLHCFYGTMTYTRARNGRVAYLLACSYDETPADFVLEQLVTFAEAGFHASSTR